MPETIPFHKIVIQGRVRQDPHQSAVNDHIQDLAASIERYGLLQPLLLDDENILQDGWCRYQAIEKLKWTDVPIYRRKSLSDSDYFEIELECNVRRLGFTWRETVESVTRIHNRRRRLAAIESKDWTMEMTGELLGGYSKSYVSNCLILEPILTDHKRSQPFNDCESITDAMRVYYRQLEDLAVAEQARRTGLVKALEPKDDVLSGLIEVPEETIDTTTHEIDLSHSLFHGDSIRDILPKWKPDSVDHIICDPPYAIDMSNLQQEGTSLMDTSRVEDEHQVGENLALFQDMFPAAYHVLRDGGFFVLWCDQMNWQLLYDIATTVGFGVQRWPLVWCKTQAKCQMAHVLITKATEIAMVCRKGKARLPQPVTSNWFIAANDEAKLSNPFAKPFELWRWLIESFTTIGQTVLDPFAGEGSSIVSGLKLNRRMLAIEKSDKHFPYLVEQVKSHWQTVYQNCKFV